MSQFNTTPLSYTGDEFSTEEKAQFRVDWDLMGKDFSNATGTLADGNLSSNVALKNIDNTFSTNQTINKAFPALSFKPSVDTESSEISFKNTVGATRGFLNYNHSNDALTVRTGGSLAATFDASNNLAIRGFLNAATGYQVEGATVIDASRNFTGGSGTFSRNVSSRFLFPRYTTNQQAPVGTGIEIGCYGNSDATATGLIQAFSRSSNSYRNLVLVGESVTLGHSGYNKLITTSSGIDVTGTVTASGGYLPFTGVHIARSDKDLKVGELVKIESKGWINEKQPDWFADYCTDSKQGVYGIVYDVFNEDILEEQDVEVEVPVMIEESYFETEIKLIDGEYQKVEIEKTREIQVYDEYPIKDSDETHKIPRTTTEIQKQDIKVGSRKVYHIAATGDGFCYTDSAVEYGDYLVPSKTKGLVSAYKGDGMPKNFVGIAGETKLEAGKISWTKE